MSAKETVEKISADEAQSLRQDAIGSTGALARALPPSAVERAASWSEPDRSARFVMSAEAPDRMGDIVVQEGLHLDNFLANPQGLLFHNSRSWPIGSWKDVEKKLSGRPKRTEGTLKLLEAGADVDADRAARHIAAGTMRTVSIGFRPDWDAVEARRDEHKHVIGLIFHQGELLECSLVPIPAMPLAVMREADATMLAREHLELIEMTLDNWALDPHTRAVVRRDVLERQYREAAGAAPTMLVVRGHLSDDLVAQFRAEMAKGGGVLIAGDDVLARSDTPPKPKDGEEVPVAPDGADGEKQKSEGLGQMDANEMLALEEEISEIIREANAHALESQEPRLWRRFLKAVGVVKGGKPKGDEPSETGETDTGTQTKTFTDEETIALRERTEQLLEKQKRLLPESAG